MSLVNNELGDLSPYQHLQARSLTQPSLLGVKLPELFAGKLNSSTKTLNASEAIKEIIAFGAQEGWIMYRDQLSISPLAPINEFFIEGEWTNGQNSIKVKLIDGKQYILTCFQISEVAANQQGDTRYAFSDQALCIRNTLKGSDQANSETAQYRLWWQLENQGEHKGRWTPFAQQFMGFNKNRESN
jgi:hypothetical protein